MTSSLRPLFEPRTLALIGASRTPGTIGWQILDNLVRHGFLGTVYPVNPGARSVHSFPAWRSVREIPVEVDLAIVVVPGESVLKVVDECAAKGITSIVVISAGFREEGAEGARRERELVDLTRRYEMRMVGPNCMGVLNTDPGVSMNATFAPTMPPPGPISFLSQSGALGVTILDYAAEYGIGIRQFVSVGNRPDVSGNDLLEYWESDPETRVILMYLETFGNPRRFTRIARRVAREKPIVVVRPGRPAAREGQRARSQTAALAGADAAAGALLAQCGVHRAYSVEELFDLAMAFGALAPPRGNRVGIVTNAGGPGAIIAGGCEAEGLTVAELGPASRREIAALVRGEGQVENPVHMGPATSAEDYGVALDHVLGDPGVDAAIAAFVPPLGARQESLAQSVVRAARNHPETPVLAVLMSRHGLTERRAELQAAGIPVYIFPESAARALAALCRHGRWLERPVQAAATFAVDVQGIQVLLDKALGAGRTALRALETLDVLEAYGIPTRRPIPIASAEEAVGAAERLGYPVVLKAFSPQIGYGGDADPPLSPLRDPGRVRDEYQRLAGRAASGNGEEAAELFIAPVPAGGRELFLGMTTNPDFGPVLSFGLGGVHAETLRDVAFRIPPVTERDAEEMIGSIRSFPLLDGSRGEPRVRIDAIVEALQRLSQLVQDHPSIAEVDVNPLLATAEGVSVLDARIGIAAPAPEQSVRSGVSEP
ncbi:MAG: acetate--CoA ligase family protein [Gemmatimonadota bacterium]